MTLELTRRIVRAFTNHLEVKAALAIARNEKRAQGTSRFLIDGIIIGIEDTYDNNFGDDIEGSIKCTYTKVHDFHCQIATAEAAFQEIRINRASYSSMYCLELCYSYISHAHGTI